CVPRGAGPGTRGARWRETRNSRRGCLGIGPQQVGILALLAHGKGEPFRKRCLVRIGLRTVGTGRTLTSVMLGLIVGGMMLLLPSALRAPTATTTQFLVDGGPSQGYSINGRFVPALTESPHQLTKRISWQWPPSIRSSLT